MIKQPPKESPLCSWGMAGLWALIIWLTVPFARRLERSVEGALGSNAFTITVLVFLAFGGLYVLRAFLKDHQRFRWSNYVWLLLVLLLLGWQTFELKGGSPIEALHFIEYGLLALFFFRAAVHHWQNAVAYVVAFCCCLSVGLVDESIQWLTPERYFDWRDIGLNAYASILIVLLLAKGLAPTYLKPITRRASAVALRFVLWPLTLGFLCLMNTPKVHERVVELFPSLKTWSQSWGEMSEYGYVYDDAEIGMFKSRFSPEALAAEDKERGFEASQILSLRRYDGYGEFIREFSPASDPYIHEARVHLHQREHYLKTRIEHREVDDAEYRRRTNIAYREEQFLRKYFPVLMKDYWHQISPEWWADMGKELPHEVSPFYSRVSSGLIVRFNQRQAVLGYLGLLALILWVSHWLNRSD